MQLGWSRESDVSRGRMSVLFLCLSRAKCYLFEVDKAIFSSGRMAFWNYFLPLDKPKMRRWGEKAIFQVLSWHFEIIFVPLTSSNLVFGDFEKAMFQVVARHCELIFKLLNSPNCDLSEVEAAMFQVVARNCEIIFSGLTSPKRD